MEKEQSTHKEIASSKASFSLKSENTSYDFTLINKGDELTFKFEDLKAFPIKLYELKIEFEKLRQSDENFSMFPRTERLIKTIKTCIQSENYSVAFDEEENAVIFEIKNEIFENGGAKIKIPEREQDINSKVESLTKMVSELKKEIQSLKINEQEKDEVAVKSFQQSSVLKEEEEKKIISKWIHPNKVIKFNMLFSSDKDGDRSSTFHYYCDGVFPTVVVILDNSGKKFGGYSTQNWCQSAIGGSYSRAPGSFIFNLSNNQKYELIDQFNTNAIYRHNSYGPVFGGGHDLYISDQCKSNNSGCSKSSYNTGNTTILGGNSSFRITSYEVYQVIFE